MAERDRLPCEFSLIQYVPDPVKGEFVNIGVLLQEQGAMARMELRFTRDWTRVRCIDPQADIASLEGLEIEWRQRMEGSSEFLRVLRDSLSTMVQMTKPKGCLAETFKTQMEQLMRLYVEAHKLPREERRNGRTVILTEMRRQFEREGVWNLMNKKIAAARYTQAGDPLRIDCGYRPNGLIRMFQAISLDGDVGMAKEFAFSASYLAEGVKRKENAELQLTAIVEPIREMGEDQERLDQYAFGRETLEKNGVRVLTMTDMERVAATARQELRV